MILHLNKAKYLENLTNYAIKMKNYNKKQANLSVKYRNYNRHNLINKNRSNNSKKITRMR